MRNLRYWRESLELTQPQMARYMGVSLHTWRKWEQGQHAPTGAGLALMDLLQELESNPFKAETIIDLRVDRVKKQDGKDRS